jgi:hypothetical protein
VESGVRVSRRRSTDDLWGGSGATTLAAWDHYTDSPMTFLHWSADAERHLEQARRRAVAQLRATPNPASWTEIGRMLRVSKQAAQQRYGAATRPVATADGSTLHDALGTERA